MHPKPDKPRPSTPAENEALERVDFKLSIIVPAYNEERSMRSVLKRLAGLDTQAPYEVIVVDDGSSDDTYNRAVEFAGGTFKILRHTTNRGKGAAVRSGIEHASGSHVLIFDADAEYDHKDIPKLIQPLFSGRAEVVYGARMRGHGTMDGAVERVWS